MLSFSEQLIQPYLEGMRRTGTGLLEVRDFLRVKLDDLWLPVQKSSTPFALDSTLDSIESQVTTLLGKIQSLKVTNLSLHYCVRDAIGKFFFRRWGHLT